jgi:hypothetical protein
MAKQGRRLTLCVDVTQNLAELGVLHEVNHGGLSTWYEDCHVTLRPLLEKQGLAK